MHRNTILDTETFEDLKDEAREFFKNEGNATELFDIEDCNDKWQSTENYGYGRKAQEITDYIEDHSSMGGAESGNRAKYGAKDEEGNEIRGGKIINDKTENDDVENEVLEIYTGEYIFTDVKAELEYGGLDDI
ncbi:MAG: hypothetical protein R3Y46_02965 [Opitutales bacterium]